MTIHADLVKKCGVCGVIACDHEHSGGHFHGRPAISEEDQSPAAAQGAISGQDDQTRLIREGDTDVAASPQSTALMSVGDLFDGSIGTIGDQDWIAIELQVGITYRIDLPDDQYSNGTLDNPRITGVFGEGGALVAAGDIASGAGFGAQVLFSPTASGTYFIGVESAIADTGNYSLNVRAVGVTNFGDVLDTTGSSARVDVGGTYDGVIGTNGDRDAVGVTLSAGVTYQIDMLGDGGRGAFTLEDTLIADILDVNGNSVNARDVGDGGLLNDDRITFTPTESGQYFIVASGELGEIGTYRLSVIEALPDAPTVDDVADDFTTTATVEVGGSFSGQINRIEDNDLIAVELSAGQTVEVTLESGDGVFRAADDLYIDAVFGPDQQALPGVYDDDGGDQLTPLLRFTAEEAGTYYIRATGFDTDTGSYTLRVNEAEQFTASGQRIGPHTPETTPFTESVSLSANQLVNALIGGQRYAPGPAETGTVPTVFYSFTNADSEFNAIYDELTDQNSAGTFFFELNDIEKEWMRDAANAVASFAQINLEEVADTGAYAGDIRIGWTTEPNDGVAAFAYFPQSFSWAAGDIWLVAQNLNRSENDGSFLQNAIIHELGHALGLKHPFEGATTLPSQFESVQYTVMSYTESTTFTNAVSSDLYPQTFMWLDILALQHIYGAIETNMGNDTYVFDGAERHYLTLWDNGGTDAIRVTNSSANLELDLREGEWSHVGTNITHRFSGGGSAIERDTVFIPDGIVIENAFGAAGHDQIIGNASANRLIGGQGADTVFGGAGNDVMFAGAGDGGNDLLFGGSGLDTLGGGAGRDLLVGDGYTSVFLNNRNDIAGSLTAEASDTIFGGAGDDTLIGDNWVDADDDGVFDAGEERDTGTGADVIYAGTGSDMVFGGGGGDILGGGTGDDTISAGTGADILYGGQGDGSDVGLNDSLSGGAGNDTIFASGGADYIEGGDGIDQLFGGGGGDTLVGGAGGDSLFGGGGDDTLTGGAGADLFSFGAGQGTDRITDFDVTEDILRIAGTTTDFTSLADVQAAASDTSVDGVDGLLIDLGGGASVFLDGVSAADLESIILLI